MGYVAVSSKVDVQLNKAIRELHKQHSDIVERLRNSGASVVDIDGSTVISCDKSQYEVICKELGIQYEV